MTARKGNSIDVARNISPHCFIQFSNQFLSIICHFRSISIKIIYINKQFSSVNMITSFCSFLFLHIFSHSRNIFVVCILMLPKLNVSIDPNRILLFIWLQRWTKTGINNTKDHWAPYADTNRGLLMKWPCCWTKWKYFMRSNSELLYTVCEHTHSRLTAAADRDDL